MKIKSISVPLAKQVEKEIKENPVGIVVAEALIYKAIEAAQHRMHLTAFGVGMLAFLAGFCICWFVFVP